MGERGGIVVDYKCKTSDSDIFSIQDEIAAGVVEEAKRRGIVIPSPSGFTAIPGSEGFRMSARLLFTKAQVASLADVGRNTITAACNEGGALANASQSKT